MTFIPIFEAPSPGDYLIIAIWGFIVFAVAASLLRTIFGIGAVRRTGWRYTATLCSILAVFGIAFMWRLGDLVSIISARYSSTTPAVEGEVKSFSTWGRSNVRFSVGGVALTYGGSPDIRYQICGRRETAYVRVKYVPRSPYNEVVSIEMGCPKEK